MMRSASLFLSVVTSLLRSVLIILVLTFNFSSRSFAKSISNPTIWFPLVNENGGTSADVAILRTCSDSLSLVLISGFVFEFLFQWSFSSARVPAAFKLSISLLIIPLRSGMALCLFMPITNSSGKFISLSINVSPLMLSLKVCERIISLYDKMSISPTCNAK